MSASSATSQAANRRSRRKSGKPEPKYLAIGRVLRPHGVRGELRLEIHTDSPARMDEVATVFLGDEHRPYSLKSIRLHQGVMLISLEGCDDRDRADTLRNELVSIQLEDAAPLQVGEYYHHQVIGLAVVTDTGEELGSVAEIIQTGANDVYVIRGQGVEVLLPAIKSVILKIEPPQMLVHLIEGLR